MNSAIPGTVSLLPRLGRQGCKYQFICKSDHSVNISKLSPELRHTAGRGAAGTPVHQPQKRKTIARGGLLGTNMSCWRVRLNRGPGTSAAGRAMKSSSSSTTCVVPSRHGVTAGVALTEVRDLLGQQHHHYDGALRTPGSEECSRCSEAAERR